MRVGVFVVFCSPFQEFMECHCGPTSKDIYIYIYIQTGQVVNNNNNVCGQNAVGPDGVKILNQFRCMAYIQSPSLP